MLYMLGGCFGRVWSRRYCKNPWGCVKDSSNAMRTVLRYVTGVMMVYIEQWVENGSQSCKTVKRDSETPLIPLGISIIPNCGCDLSFTQVQTDQKVPNFLGCSGFMNISKFLLGFFCAFVLLLPRKHNWGVYAVHVNPPEKATNVKEAFLCI